MICSLATNLQSTLMMGVKLNLRLTLASWFGSPTTSVKSQKSSSNIGGRTPPGSARAASRQTSTPANTDRCASVAPNNAVAVIG